MKKQLLKVILINLLLLAVVGCNTETQAPSNTTPPAVTTAPQTTERVVIAEPEIAATATLAASETSMPPLPPYHTQAVYPQSLYFFANETKAEAIARLDAAGIEYAQDDETIYIPEHKYWADTATGTAQYDDAGKLIMVVTKVKNDKLTDAELEREILTSLTKAFGTDPFAGETDGGAIMRLWNNTDDTEIFAVQVDKVKGGVALIWRVTK